MKKLKEQKGITLMALIITIIVLVILAMVTISEVRDGGMIEYTENSIGRYKKEQDKEKNN